MALSIDHATKRITIPQADLTFVSGTLYELNTETFRNNMNTLMASEEFIYLDDYAIRNAPVTVTGTTFAQTIEITNSWSLTFQNIAMTVRLANSNNNFFDVDGGILINQPLVNVIGQNSAGLVIAATVDSTKLAEIHQDLGLTSGAPKTITENTVDTSYDETSTGITKEIRKSGATTTVTRA